MDDVIVKTDYPDFKIKWLQIIVLIMRRSHSIPATEGITAA